MLDSLKHNFERLISLYETEKQKNSDLAERLEKSEALNEACKKQIIELENQIDNLKLAEAFRPAGEGSRAGKERIDKLIKEIDKCISLLEK